MGKIVNENNEEYEELKVKVQDELNKTEVRVFGGVTSTKIPRYELIPKSTLDSLAGRFELGIKRKGEGAWNALRPDLQETLRDGKFVIDRLAHCIGHCYDAIQKVASGATLGEDDAGAILFAGSVLAEWRKMKLERRVGKDSSQWPCVKSESNSGEEER